VCGAFKLRMVTSVSRLSRDTGSNLV
jgi:hypothetical protein